MGVTCRVILPALATLFAVSPGLTQSARPLDEVSDRLVEVIDHPDQEVLEIVIGPATLHGGGPHLRLPIQLARIPFEGWLHGFEWTVTDGRGNALPDDLLHHVNLIDADHRELFAPIARRVMAAGRETKKQEAPHLVGYPVGAGNRLIVSAMFASPEADGQLDAYLHVRLFYTKRGESLIAPRDVYPFYLDVMGPVGLKDFPVPPGRTVKSWEGSPAIDGRILAIGGHLHDYAREIRLEDVTAGKTIWKAQPKVDDQGRVVGVPTAHLWWKLGVRVHRDRRYRIVAVYENPTDRPTPNGGMGAIGGILLPSGDAEWPDLDRQDPAYLADLRNTLAAPEELGHGHDGHHGASN